MTGNKNLYWLFTIIRNLLSWVGLVVYAGFKYGTFLAAEGAGIVIMFALAIAFAVVMWLRSLKEVAETGYGMAKKLARAVRFGIPLIAGLAATLILKSNIAGIVDILVIGFAGNIAAIPFWMLAYRCSQEYVRDTGINAIIKKL